ncbi:MAG: hypothetical protein Q9160_007613 [Pyrenula sp. 1 TL-2023]
MLSRHSERPSHAVYPISSPSTSESSFPHQGASVKNPFVIPSSQTTPATRSFTPESERPSLQGFDRTPSSQEFSGDSSSASERSGFSGSHNFISSTEASPSPLATSTSAYDKSPSRHKIREKLSQEKAQNSFDLSSPAGKSTQVPFDVLSSPPDYSSVDGDNSVLLSAGDLLSGKVLYPQKDNRMVREREPPRAPLFPTIGNQETRQGSAINPDLGGKEMDEGSQPQARSNGPNLQPAFGKPTQLGSSEAPSFHRQKPPSVPKPEERLFHKSKTDYNPIHYLQNLAKDRPFSLSGTSQPQPQSRNQDVGVPIQRPTNPSYSTQAQSERQYTSQPYDDYSNSQSSKLKNFIDLTGGNLASSQTYDSYGYQGNKFEPEIYVDSAKAHENIKDLLEGAFEDEEDKPRTRSRKKKAAVEATKLADKLQSMSVNDQEPQNGEEGDVDEFDGTVEGLKVKLLPHQIEGYEWMREKENGTKKLRGVLPKGGILADDMGLGKTIQSIALIMTNQKPSEAEIEAMNASKEKNKRTLPAGLDKGTLVVAPLALIKQWEAEIKDKVEDSHALRVCVHHGPQRAKHSKDLKKHDIVITTYNTLTSEHAASSDTIKTGCFGVQWYRVILDEAHSIKNRTAKQTQAACALRAEYRWCLTGTPMQNNLDELQSLIKFLRIKPYDELPAWREQITKPMNNGRGGLAIKRLQVYLKAFMKRRTKDVLKQEGALHTGTTTNEGGETKSTSFRIVKRTIERIEADFSPAERSFYDRLEQRTDSSLKRMMAGETLSYASALTLLLRLRQVCNHPKLVKSDLSKEKDGFETMKTGTQSPKKKAVRDEEVDDITNLMGGLGVNTKQCDVCQAELSTREIAAGAIRCTDCEADLEDDTLKPQKKKHKRKDKHRKKHSRDTVKAKPDRKPRNRRIVVDSDDEEEEDGGEWLVPEDKCGKTKLGRAGGSDDENAEGGGIWLGSDESADESEDDNQTSASVLKGKNKEVISLDSEDEQDENEDEDDDSDDDETDSSSASSTFLSPFPKSKSKSQSSSDLILSTKIRHLLTLLTQHSPTHKFIIFSFFTSMLDLIEPFLLSSPSRSLRSFTRYDGQMRNDAREASLQRLRTDPKCRILLCSLKSGSLGLNLTAASRVVILEPFWNPFVEEQAIDRVHRLNQTEDVVVYKLTVKDTVETRILELQERKRELAEATIEGRQKGNALAKLSMREMLALFKHDAEEKHAVDGIGMGLALEKGKGGLMERSSERSSGGQSSSREGSRGQLSERRSGGGAQKKLSGGAERRKEDAVYGRRW